MEEKGLGQQELIKPGQKLLPGVDEEAPQEAMKREPCWAAWVQVSRPGWGQVGGGWSRPRTPEFLRSCLCLQVR